MMYLAYSYPLGQPALPTLGAHTPIATADYAHPQYVTAVTAPSIAEPYLVPVTAAQQLLQATPASYQPLTLAVCRKVMVVFIVLKGFINFVYLMTLKI